MAADTQRQLAVLIGLFAVLVAVAWWQFGGAATPPTAAARSTRPAARPGRPDGAPAETPAQVLARGVGLDRLAADRPAPEEAGRDPFRSGTAASSGNASPEASRPVPSLPPPPVMPISPVMPQGPPPIALKFIGLVSRRDVGKVAVLTDGKNVYYGREGDIVDGRWRIVSIGEESLQIEYADGRGRQSVRMTG